MDQRDIQIYNMFIEIKKIYNKWQLLYANPNNYVLDPMIIRSDLSVKKIYNEVSIMDEIPIILQFKTDCRINLNMKLNYEIIFEKRVEKIYSNLIENVKEVSLNTENFNERFSYIQNQILLLEEDVFEVMIIEHIQYVMKKYFYLKYRDERKSEVQFEVLRINNNFSSTRVKSLQILGEIDELNLNLLRNRFLRLIYIKGLILK